MDRQDTVGEARDDLLGPKRGLSAYRLGREVLKGEEQESVDMGQESASETPGTEKLTSAGFSARTALVRGFAPRWAGEVLCSAGLAARAGPAWAEVHCETGHVSRLGMRARAFW